MVYGRGHSGGLASAFTASRHDDTPHYPNSFPRTSNEITGAGAARRSSSAATNNASAAIPITTSTGAMMMRRSASDQQLNSFDERQAELDYQDRSMAMFSRIVAHRESQRRQKQQDDDDRQQSPSTTATFLAVEGKYHHQYQRQDVPAPPALYYYPTKTGGHWAYATTEPASGPQASSFLIPPSNQQQQASSHLHSCMNGQGQGAGCVEKALSVVTSLEQRHCHHMDYHDTWHNDDQHHDHDDGVFDLEL